MTRVRVKNLQGLIFFFNDRLLWEKDDQSILGVRWSNVEDEWPCSLNTSGSVNRDEVFKNPTPTTSNLPSFIHVFLQVQYKI